MKYPVIATRGIVVFPGHSTILEVGRKASLNAIDFSAVSYENQLIVVSQKNVMEDEITKKSQLYTVGTLVTYTLHKEYPNGSKAITVIGKERVKLNKINFNNNQLIEADIEILKNKSSTSAKEQAFVNKISEQLDGI